MKNLVNNGWNNAPAHTPFTEKENIVPNTQFAHTVSAEDREFLKNNIINALDAVVHLAADSQSKVIVSSMENVIYNIAQCDYEIWAKSCLN